ncbi:PD-(D/E)XK nuclease family protein [Saccharothrix australiensis]|uniref:PD-(D/E)XK nuclease superfamily protein n=1 Tax=Saccharothrix australiensis TaxID=2072 RepID=A0A495W765_9PSEU|nr:PD-(D/E)XK nuclease family protein [Saccharothrix australiensis]RKT56655.1 PD-(D/E)XK nuclease superfamily protein [Saccharothrix australiensis]
MDVLDLMEFSDQERSVDDVVADVVGAREALGSRGRAHDGLIAWTVEAVGRYLGARRQYAVGDDAWVTAPVGYPWVVRTSLRDVDHRGVDYYEQTCWGRRYASADGQLREIWLLSFGEVKRDRGAAEVALAAYAVAHGEPCHPAYGRRHEPLRGLPPGAYELPHRVRVVEYGCGSGGFEWVELSREQALAGFRETSAPVLATALSGVGRTPGRDCVGCGVIAECDAVPRARLQPGIAPSKWMRRSVSASDLRAHVDCPASYHLTRQLKLRQPGAVEDPAVVRGRVVDDWLNRRHAARPARRCQMDEVPGSLEEWRDGRFTIDGEEAGVAARMLRQHTLFCPIGKPGTGDRVWVQRTLSLHDPELDLVFVATPDLVYERSGAPVWRETKTTRSHLWTGQPLLSQYPQVALAVLMVAGGVLGDTTKMPRIELELLNDGDCGLEEVDPGRPEVVEEAREVIRPLLDHWLADADFPARPGRACDHCAALAWCAPGSSHVKRAEVEATGV